MGINHFIAVFIRNLVHFQSNLDLDDGRDARSVRNQHT